MAAAPHPFDLNGRTALVTGAARGLGFEIARGLAAAGARVYLGGRDPATLAAAADRLVADGLAAEPLPFDVTDRAAARAGLEAIASDAGGLDILVNNAAMRDRRALADFSEADVARLLDTNLAAQFDLARAAAAQMIPKGRGRIINITSIAAHISLPGDALYGMAKGGLAAMTRALAPELGRHGITVNAICPGFFATEFNAPLVADEAVSEMPHRRTSLGRWGRPEEIAGAAVFLASDAASYITGQSLAVDGGYLTHY